MNAVFVDLLGEGRDDVIQITGPPAKNDILAENYCCISTDFVLLMVQTFTNSINENFSKRIDFVLSVDGPLFLSKIVKECGWLGRIK
ncbi:hypothetical protein Hrd1104_00195 [Halorhabdus sp. CBA1104]|nr:hypothetical protein Hrd1104_00195 [Halorhabdus sp. CBA1104]